MGVTTARKGEADREGHDGSDDPREMGRKAKAEEVMAVAVVVMVMVVVGREGGKGEEEAWAGGGEVDGAVCSVREHRRWWLHCLTALLSSPPWGCS